MNAAPSATLLRAHARAAGPRDSRAPSTHGVVAHVDVNGVATGVEAGPRRRAKPERVVALENDTRRRQRVHCTRTHTRA